jgi:hypothetical protein
VISRDKRSRIVQSAKIVVSGGDRFVLMSAHHNRLLSATLEHPGMGGAMLAVAGDNSGSLQVVGLRTNSHIEVITYQDSSGNWHAGADLTPRCLLASASWGGTSRPNSSRLMDSAG